MSSWWPSVSRSVRASPVPAGVLKSDDISKRQVSDAIEAINGKVAGVQMVESNDPAASNPTIRIRGVSSINASSSPLIVLDGLPYSGNYSDINPQDVESISVLKDAASNALYGARGANGVIMITTKHAQKGKAAISLDAKWGSNSSAYVNYDYITDPAQYYELYYKGLYNYYTNSQGQTSYNAWKSANTALVSEQTNGGLGEIIYSVPSGQSLIGQNGKLNPQATLGNVVTNNGNQYLLTSDDWRKTGIKTGLRQEYNMSINGGDDQFQFYGSGSYLSNEGITNGADFKRYNGMMKIDYQARKWLKIGGTARFIHTNSNSNNYAYYGSLTTPCIYPVYVRDANGNILTDANGKVYDYGDGLITGVIRPNARGDNYIQDDLLTLTNSKSNALGFAAYSDISFLRDFKLTLNVNIYDTENRSMTGRSPDYGYSGQTGGYASTYHYRTYSVNTQQLLNWSKSLGQHSLYLLFGHEYTRDNDGTLGAAKSNIVNYAANKELDGAVTLLSSEGYTSIYNVEGWFFRANYDYASRYFASFSFRRDGSSRFSPDHRWGNFWSLGGAWIMNKEPWFPKTGWIDQLKLKASYGEQGNDNIGEFRYTDFYKITTANGKAALSFSQKGKDDITWEKNGNFNAGIDFELFNHRVTGSLEYYHRKTTDMLLWFTTPVSIGYTGYYDNVGDMVNKGVEFSISGDIIRKKDFNWNVNFNISHNKNKVTYLPDENKIINMEGHDGYRNLSNYNFVGEGLPLYTWYMPKYAGPNSQGQSTWYVTNADGTQSTTTTYSQATYYLCGDANPKVYGGFGTTVSAYGFDLTASFLYSLGGKGIDYGYRALMGSATSSSERGNLHKDLLNAWSTDNTTSTIPRFQYGDENSASMSDRFLTSNNSLTFKNISLGYTFPRRLVEKLKLTSLRIYCSCDNVYYWTKRKGYDPRTALDGQVRVQDDSDLNFTYYQPIRTISGGITVKF
jgi:TonB-linked SusC/RagA family outer membrane protein